MEAEKRDEDRKHENDHRCEENAESFGVKVAVDDVAQRNGEHLVNGVVIDVKAVAVFPKEAQDSVFEERLGERQRPKRHGDESCRANAYDRKAEGRNEEVILPLQAMVDEEDNGQDRDADSKDAGSQLKHALTRRRAEKSA